jgi:hypothetical protein
MVTNHLLDVGMNRLWTIGYSGVEDWWPCKFIHLAGEHGLALGNGVSAFGRSAPAFEDRASGGFLVEFCFGRRTGNLHVYPWLPRDGSRAEGAESQRHTLLDRALLPGPSSSTVA